MAVYWFFGLLWTVQFVQACSWTTMSGAVVYWFFFRKDPTERTRVPILRSAARVARYHLGSMAFGALVIALCQFMRALLEYLDRQTQQAQGMSNPNPNPNPNPNLTPTLNPQPLPLTLSRRRA